MSVEDIAGMQTAENTELRQKINELVQQNAELVAYCEDSKHVMMVVANCDTKEAANVIADKWIEQTPQQSLANIKADAIEEFGHTLLELYKYTISFGTLDCFILDYANQLREQI